MGQEEERTQNSVVETISPDDIGSIDNLMGPSPEPTPEEESVEEVVGEKMEQIDWNPVENPKIIECLNTAAEAIIGLGTESYRNDGSSKYVAFSKGNRRGVVCIFLNKKSARISVGQLDGKKTIWPKNLNYRVTEDGYHLNGKKVKLSTIVSKIKAYIKSRGW